MASVTNSMDMNLSKLWERVKDREVWSAAVHGISECWDLVTEQKQRPKDEAKTFHSFCLLYVSKGDVLRDPASI